MLFVNNNKTFKIFDYPISCAFYPCKKGAVKKTVISTVFTIAPSQHVYKHSLLLDHFNRLIIKGLQSCSCQSMGKYCLFWSEEAERNLNA